MSVLRSPITRLKLIGSASQTTNIANISLEKLNPLTIAIPPKGEQTRIVAKVDELMALCDQLEQQTESSLSAHQTLVETLLNTLLNADQNSFDQAWERIAQHFDILFTTEHSIDQLKQTILQLAVMGKLVPQDPNDEPASVLLEKIAAEKEQLIKDKVIKKQKPLPPISEDEKPFELPKGWEWSRLGDVAILQGGFAYKSTLFTEVGNNQVVRMGNIRPDYLRLKVKAVYISDDLALETSNYQIQVNDVLLTMTGTKNKRDYLYSLAVNSNHLEGRSLYLNQRMCMARPIQFNSLYLNTVLKDDRLLNDIFAKSTGTANQANIGMEALLNWVIPIAPLSMQVRIEQKKNSMLDLCNTLKECICESQSVQLHLADAMAEQALN